MGRREAAHIGLQAISCDGLESVNVGSRLDACYELLKFRLFHAKVSAFLFQAI